jgi:hypothetical protein
MRVDRREFALASLCVDFSIERRIKSSSMQAAKAGAYRRNLNPNDDKSSVDSREVPHQAAIGNSSL